MPPRCGVSLARATSFTRKRGAGAATVAHAMGAHEFEDLPDRRTSLVGITDEQDEAWLIRSIAQKLYRCPDCHGTIAIGDEHVVCQYVRRIGGTEHHHWHRDCATRILLPGLRNVRKVEAAQSGRENLEARGAKRPGRRRRPY